MAKHTKEFLNARREEKTEERYTVKSMLQTEFYNLIHLERRKFFYTAIELTIHPGKSIRKVIDGYRSYLYPYFNYLVLVCTITIFLSVRYKFFVSGFDIDDGNNVVNDFTNSLGFDREFRMGFMNYAEEFATLVNIIAIPVFTLFTYIFFRKNKYNLAEHFILNVYIGAQQMLFLWLTIPFLEISRTYQEVYIGIYSVLIVFYNIWVYVSFFEGRVYKKLLLATLAVGAAYFFQVPVNYLVYFFIKPFINWLDPIF